MTSEQAALRRAIRNAGGLDRIAVPLDISRQAVHKWKRVPANRVLGVERVSGVSRHELRPDIYPLENRG